MAVGDVYSARIDMEMPSGPASMNFHYQETTEPSSLTGPQGLAVGIVTDQFGLIANAISNQCAVTACQVYKKSGNREVPYQATLVDGVGNENSEALPALNGVRINLLQSFFSARSNGLVWLPGVPRNEVTTSVVDQAFIAANIVPWTTAMLAGVSEPAAGDGRWRLIVISRRFLQLNPNDWEGAAADVTEITVNPIIGRQRRRRTKVRGGAATNISA